MGRWHPIGVLLEAGMSLGPTLVGDRYLFTLVLEVLMLVGQTVGPPPPSAVFLWSLPSLCACFISLALLCLSASA